MPAVDHALPCALCYDCALDEVEQKEKSSRSHIPTLSLGQQCIAASFHHQGGCSMELPQLVCQWETCWHQGRSRQLSQHPENTAANMLACSPLKHTKYSALLLQPIQGSAMSHLSTWYCRKCLGSEAGICQVHHVTVRGIDLCTCMYCIRPYCWKGIAASRGSPSGQDAAPERIHDEILENSTMISPTRNLVARSSSYRPESDADQDLARTRLRNILLPNLDQRIGFLSVVLCREYSNLLSHGSR